MPASTHPSRPILALVLDVALFGLALLVLRRVLAEYRYPDVLGAMKAVGLRPVATSLAVSLLGYTALIGYEYLSLRLVGRLLPLRRMWLPSFVSFAVANSAPSLF
jgi:phosphatidylglycerol lysyltransferase